MIGYNYTTCNHHRFHQRNGHEALAAHAVPLQVQHAMILTMITLVLQMHSTRREPYKWQRTLPILQTLITE